MTKHIHETQYGTYQVQIRGAGARLNKTFKTLDEAIAARDAFIGEHSLPPADIPAGHKYCGGCRSVKALTDFTANNAKCRECTTQYQVKRRKDPNVRGRENELHRRRHRENPDAQRNRQLKHWYDIGLRDYNEMFSSQGEVCAICQKPETAVIKGKIAALAVDHKHNHTCDHDRSGQKACTECIRGLLCRDCNTILGKINDSTDWLESAIEYLRKWDRQTG